MLMAAFERPKVLVYSYQAGSGLTSHDANPHLTKRLFALLFEEKYPVTRTHTARVHTSKRGAPN